LKAKVQGDVERILLEKRPAEGISGKRRRGGGKLERREGFVTFGIIRGPAPKGGGGQWNIPGQQKKTTSKIVHSESVRQ